MTLIANTSLAQTQAERNLTANLGVLGTLQPSLIPWIAEQYLAVEWVFGRDRALTALDEAGQWSAGCSIPLRAAEAMFARVEVRGAVGCFLAPTHAAQIRVVLQKLKPEQAIIAAIPDMRDLALILRCDDFSTELASHRLWFAAGPAWDIALKSLFDERSGMAVPGQFIRSPDTDKTQIEEMIGTAQGVFTEIGADRAAEMQRIRAAAARPVIKRDKRRICVLAPANFRLWNDIGSAMLQIFSDAPDFEVVHFNGDDPLQTSPLALLDTARGCDIIFTANTSRSDLPGLLPDYLPWITWVTAARIPSSALAGDADHLIVVDPALATAALKNGWKQDRVHLGNFPRLIAPPAARATSLGIIVDTIPLDTPKDLNDYSSHTLLWESIRNELTRDPFCLTDINSFLNERMRKFEIADDAFQPQRFIEKLILPAYQQGLARTLIRAGIKPKIFGAGWDQIEEFTPYAVGAIKSGDQFYRAISQVSALLHAWPSAMAHPIEALGVPVVRRTGRAEALVREVKKLTASAQASVAAGQTPALSLALLRSCLKKP